MDVFLDTNVLFSACLRPAGRSRALFALAQDHRCRLWVSGYVLEEGRRNLASKAPTALDALAGLTGMLDRAPDSSGESVRWCAAQGLPDKDAPILAAAIRANADILITGDRRHFGSLFGRTFRSVLVLPLADGLAAVLAGPGRSR